MFLCQMRKIFPPKRVRISFWMYFYTSSLPPCIMHTFSQQLHFGRNFTIVDHAQNLVNTPEVLPSSVNHTDAVCDTYTDSICALTHTYALSPPYCLFPAACPLSIRHVLVCPRMRTGSSLMSPLEITKSLEKTLRL